MKVLSVFKVLWNSCLLIGEISASTLIPHQELPRRLLVSVAQLRMVPTGIEKCRSILQVMCSEVLNRLVNHILEFYIDDVVTHAPTEAEFANDSD